MTPISNRSQLVNRLLPAFMAGRWDQSDIGKSDAIVFINEKFLPEAEKQGICFCINDDHTREADTEFMKYTDHGIQNLKDGIQNLKAGQLKENTPGVSPAAVFGFGTALDALTIHYKKLARIGWNGKNMFIYYVPANRYPSVTDIAKKEFGEFTQYNAYFAIKNVDGSVSTWVPSVNDCLAKDWYIVE